ncbi:hypothetical protein CUB89_04285 [Akkermansia muciniphila]|jgi:hypothetical protein|nr:hypothetical protein CUB89_04285 [Akkermansia muciniphila]
MAGVSVKRNEHPHHRNRKNPVKNGKQKNLPCGKSSIPPVPFQHSKLSPSGTGKKIPAITQVVEATAKIFPATGKPRSRNNRKRG